MTLPGASNDRRAQLAEIINTAVELGLRNLSTLIPAKVVKWDNSNGRADCQILVKNVTEAEDGEREVNSWPVIPGVVVQFVGAGGYRITCPISDGQGSTPSTIGSLAFCHRSLDKWLSGDGSEVDPELDHDHALTDAIFYPGLMPFGSPWSSMPNDEMTIGYDTGPQAHFQQNMIVLGDVSGSKAIAIDGDSAGWLYWTPNVPPGGAAVLTYQPPSIQPPITPVAPMVRFDLVIAAGATEAKAK